MRLCLLLLLLLQPQLHQLLLLRTKGRKEQSAQGLQQHGSQGLQPTCRLRAGPTWHPPADEVRLLLSLPWLDVEPFFVSTRRLKDVIICWAPKHALQSFGKGI